MADKNSDFILRMLERLDQKIDDLIGKYTDQKIQFEGHYKVDEANDSAIRQDVVEVKETLLVQSKHLEEYNQQLKEHIRRTELLEARMEPLEADLLGRRAQQEYVDGRWKRLSVIVAVVSGIVGGVWSLVQFLFFKS